MCLYNFWEALFLEAYMNNKVIPRAFIMKKKGEVGHAESALFIYFLPVVVYILHGPEGHSAVVFSTWCSVLHLSLR